MKTRIHSSREQAEMLAKIINEEAKKIAPRFTFWVDQCLESYYSCPECGSLFYEVDCGCRVCDFTPEVLGWVVNWLYVVGKKEDAEDLAAIFAAAESREDWPQAA